MNVREKTLVSLMVVAVASWGIYTLFLKGVAESSLESPESTQARVVKFVEESRMRISGATQKGLIGHAASGIVKPWSCNPFSSGVKGSVLAPKAEETAVRYSGYLNIGGQLFALLNNRAYRLGDSLAESVYSVRSIDPTQVVLNVNGSDKTVVVKVEDALKRGGRNEKDM